MVACALRRIKVSSAGYEHTMNTQQAIRLAARQFQSLSSHVFNVLNITKPVSPEAAVNLAKVVSKLSPILGNMIEFNTVEFLNDVDAFKPFGTWVRQDPGFPDAIFQGKIGPAPGFEIKAWFPLATEITARFKDSQTHFKHDATYVALLAWLPDHLIFGKPRIVGVCVVSGKSVAEARDSHYHKPPDYLVLEPEDTSARTRNLQQTNTSGHKWQGTTAQLQQAEKIVRNWGKDGRVYKPTRSYQKKLRQLIARFPYRLDTNFAKMDRIVHLEIEAFKTRVLGMEFQGHTIGQWAKILYRADEQVVRIELQKRFGIADRHSRELLR